MTSMQSIPGIHAGLLQCVQSALQLRADTHSSMKEAVPEMGV